MKRSFTSITSVWRSKRRRGDFARFFYLAAVAVVLPLTSLAFQTEEPAAAQEEGRNPFVLLEAGGHERDLPVEIALLGEGRYEEALARMTPEIEFRYPWFKEYLENLVRVSSPLVKRASDHFDLYLPAEDAFLADYALPALEKVAAHLNGVFGHRPRGRIRVEIYPDQETFSTASTLSIETLERSGAIGICKFHRLMIMSPRSLPMGYRWLDALAHEYLHLIINEMTDSRAELWLHEGTARYFETSYRSDPPDFLTPSQQTSLLEALEKGELVSFERMSPSMVYLKDQKEVSLAFAQVSHAVSHLIEEHGRGRFVSFLKSLRSRSFPDAFRRAYGVAPSAFERRLHDALAQAPWEKAKGAMSDEIRFGTVEEADLIGASAMGKVRLGDRMRQRGWMEAALIQYEGALKEEPDNALILLKAARAHLALEQRDAAVEKLRRATLKNPNYVTPHVELAGLLEGEEALRHLEEAVAINPFDPRVHARLEAVYRGLGRKKDADRAAEIHRRLTS